MCVGLSFASHEPFSNRQKPTEDMQRPIEKILFIFFLSISFEFNSMKNIDKSFFKKKLLIEIIDRKTKLTHSDIYRQTVEKMTKISEFADQLKK